MAHRPLLLVCARAALLLAVATGTTGAACLDEIPLGTSECEELCEIEELCGLRSYSACTTERCGEAGATRGGAADDCMLSIVEASEASDAGGFDCTELVFCTCDDSCGSVDACTGSSDPACGSTCETLVEQDPVATYQENRCRIESSCEDLALCGGV